MKNEWVDLNFANIGILEDLYEKYKTNPASIDPKWHKVFQEIDAYSDKKPQTISEKKETLTLTPSVKESISNAEERALRVYNLIYAYRTYGHLMAKVNPIATHPIAEPYQLQLKTLGFSSDELDDLFPTFGLLESDLAPLREIIETLKQIYCNKIGIEYMEVHTPEMESWLQKQIEPTRFKNQLTIEEKQMILNHLNRSELFESFLQTKYVGQKRFSLEGGETLIPMLQEIVEIGAKSGVEDIVIGMAHRGRLNVLSNILNKSYVDIFTEFQENYIPDSFEGGGDVKYHKGYSSEVQTRHGRKINISLTPNPSHLEAVDPVVTGQARAKQVLRNDLEFQDKVFPVLIHGDAALAGQGVVYETMQFLRLPGYSTGGTIHLVINNQIGFTTLPDESRSTQYCTDIAHTFGSPVFHVNAEDPEGCVYATQLAIQLRQKFHCDVFIDLNCYRKYGHNETDEPAFTQPLEYQLIRKKRPIREIYRDTLIQEGELEKYIAESLEVEFKKTLQQALKDIKIFPESSTEEQKSLPEFKPDKMMFIPVQTGVSKDILRQLTEKICTFPVGFNIHPKLENLLKERLSMLDEGESAKPIDWGMGELLAYATIINEGIDVRLSGQDVCRGTFSHRHAVWTDQQVEIKKYSPLSQIKKGQGRFDIYNSPLSEYAVLGFEFGYSIACRKSLVLWEAQFGDFCNGAQIIIDQFIATSEQKWGKKSNLTLLLPHGYEGQGPEHSSARMERFLSLAGNENMLIVDPTTPAQLFHLLRRQVVGELTKPLIVFTPKGLLRHPDCVSRPDDLAQGSFQEILDDPKPGKNVRRIVFCTGRIYYDLKSAREKEKIDDMAIIRIEQLYPLNEEKVKNLLKKYDGFKECYWVQEEPSNMGAWEFIRSILSKLLPENIPLKYVGRSRSASPATGSHAWHKKEHAAILHALFKENQMPPINAVLRA